jgi:glycosyltransferase involved in cell wall biosynthesis
MREKPVIMTQIINPQNVGGTITVYKDLLNSSLKEFFEFVPLIQHNISLSIKEILKLRKFIKTTNPDLVDVQGVNIEALPVIVAAKLANAKVVMGVHGMYSDHYKVPGLKKWIYGWITEPLSFYLADGVYCVCEFATRRKKVTRFTRRMLGFSYNPAPDYNSYNKKAIRESLRLRLGLNESAIVGIMASRLTYNKGASFLMDALSQLHENWPQNLHVIIIGDGEYLSVIREKLITLIEDKKLILTGQINDVYKYLFAADFYISPSLHENHSISLLEASSAGLALLATRVGGNPEIVEDGINGKLIPALSSGELTKGIRMMVEKKENLKAMGLKSIEIAQTKFNLQSWNQRRKEIYLSMITEKNIHNKNRF